MANATTQTPTAEFLAVVREYLPGLAPGQHPEPDVPLSSYGLDSLGSISLMLALEEALELTFPEELLTAERFSTTGSLWATVLELRQTR
ncbi:phosphopantetheine-binding protein [Streptomyces sp. MBT62]|uniref:phosphopantetheine-binding protein n=1 Tax=Streptomyces sp. MBT62 TaxID=2800410 RepID=UPI00190BB5B9|nr:phosphopantetheine-binding protein [Streptomyces sp. MBT62]MBK3569780.1 acyl carrier protein [Streptomyces sp. MBT62]